MKIKHTIIIFLLGLILHIVGAWLKITHLTGYQNIILLVASLLEIVGLLLLCFKLFTSKKFKDFMNS